MNERTYFSNEAIDDIVWPDVGLRPVFQGLRKHVRIPGKRAVVDRNIDHTYEVVSTQYYVVPHQEVLEIKESIVSAFPEWGEPTREIWFSNDMGRMKTRWTFRDVDYKIGKLPDGTPDTVHPTMESGCSYDTSLAQSIFVGGFRLVCTNGMKVGKMLAEYKRKHTLSLDLEVAKAIISQGMDNYQDAALMWQAYAERLAFINEVNAFEIIGFNKAEKINVEKNIKQQGKVLVWEDVEPEERKVEINAWDLYNIYTEEASHRIDDVTRRSKVINNIANTFVH